jgi:hypothetical protein
MKQQQKITYLLAPMQRAHLMIRQLSLWLHPEEVLAIPDELISQLAGVLPKTALMARQQFCQNQLHADENKAVDRHLAAVPHLIQSVDIKPEVLKESLRQKKRGQKRVFCPLFNKK